MAGLTEQQVAEKIAGAKVNQEAQKPAAVVPPKADDAKPAEVKTEIGTTNEFGDKKDDPTFPVKENGKVCVAKQPFKTEKAMIGDKEETINWYRVYEKNGDLVEVPYQLSNGSVVSKEGREQIKQQNQQALQYQHELLAEMKKSDGPRMLLMEFLRKFTTIHGMTTPNEVACELAVVLAPTDKNITIAQKRYKTAIREKSPGGVKQWLATVPARCYDLLTEGNSVYDEETVKDICGEKEPALKTLIIFKDEFPKVLLSVFGGALKVAANIYDGNTAKFSTVGDIPSINNMPGGVELVYYTIDDKKALLTEQTVRQKPGETSEAFMNRVKENTARREKGERYKSGGMTIDEKASILRVRSNARTSMVSSLNFIPLRTFETVPVGVRVNPQAASELNHMYLSKLGTGVIRAPEENANLRDVDGVIESSIYFPAEDALAGKIKPIKRYFRQRVDGKTLTKPVITPRAVIAKELVKTDKGTVRSMNKAHSFNEEGYNNKQMEYIKGMFKSYMSNLPEAMRCQFPSVDELVAANKRSRSTNVTAKISNSGIDQGLLDQGLLMLDIAIGHGKANTAIAETKQGIEAIRSTKAVSVVNRKRFTQEQLANRLAPKA